VGFSKFLGGLIQYSLRFWG